MKKKVVVFTKNGARILTNPSKEYLEQWKQHPNVLVEDADLRSVKGIPPHFWKLRDDGMIVEMSESEKKEVTIDMQERKTHPALKKITKIEPLTQKPEIKEVVKIKKVVEYRTRKLHLTAAAVAGVLVGTMMGWSQLIPKIIDLFK